MATQLTPSKQVSLLMLMPRLDKTRPTRSRILTSSASRQAASSLEKFKMGDSPVKKLNFEPTDKENAPLSAALDVAKDIKPVVEKSVEKSVVKEAPKAVPSIKELEASEPLLQENPHRFVLFPIKYHEVSFTSTNASRAKWFLANPTRTT